MAQEFKYLFTPLKIGPITVRNRIMSLGHQEGMSKDGMPTEQWARYHAERAKGGVGLIELAAANVHPVTMSIANMNNIYDDKYIPGFRLVADMVHEHGAKIVAQIAHVGRNASSMISERLLT